MDKQYRISVGEANLEVDEKHSFLEIKMPSFKSWLGNKTSMKEFQELSYPHKRETFLLWKWGFSNPSANEELEMSEKETLIRFSDSSFDDLKQTTIGRWIIKKRKWNDYCSNTWKSIEDNSFFLEDSMMGKEIIKELNGKIV